MSRGKHQVFSEKQCAHLAREFGAANSGDKLALTQVAQEIQSSFKKSSGDNYSLDTIALGAAYGRCASKGVDTPSDIRTVDDALAALDKITPLWNEMGLPVLANESKEHPTMVRTVWITCYGADTIKRLCRAAMNTPIPADKTFQVYPELRNHLHPEKEVDDTPGEENDAPAPVVPAPLMSIGTEREHMRFGLEDFDAAVAIAREALFKLPGDGT